MIWEKVNSFKYINERGNVILKYRMAGKFVFLCYMSNDDIEGGNYMSKCSLRTAQQYFAKDEKHSVYTPPSIERLENAPGRAQ